MATYRHWSVSLWRDPDDVPHCQILSPDKTEWRLISATLCRWRRCFVADQLWFRTRILEEEEEVVHPHHNCLNTLCSLMAVIIITKTMFMVLSSWQSHCKSSPGSFDEYRMVPSGRRPKTKPDDLGCESVCTGCQSLHPPSPCIIINQPESWYSFSCPTEGRRLSRPYISLRYSLVLLNIHQTNKI